ncbi:hypothetical protein ZWY2020_059173 [Hordeum vulgare]|nr:hypothetical protein ZWY2020_059173 [Hordeum vulgare]
MKFFSAFDPWPVFFRREWGRTWPIIAGFATMGVIITKITAGFTEEDLKNSKFVQAHKSSRPLVPCVQNVLQIEYKRAENHLLREEKMRMLSENKVLREALKNFVCLNANCSTKDYFNQQEELNR